MKKMVFKAFQIAFLSAALLLVGSSMALASDRSASGTFSHTSYNADYGLKAFSYNISYTGNSYSGIEAGQTYTAVNRHDVLVYVSPGFVYPPNIGNGSPTINIVNLQNSSGSNLSSLGAYAFSNGTYRGYLLPEGSLILICEYSSSVLQGIPQGSYRVELQIKQNLDDDWSPAVFSPDAVRTSYFSS
jgi:hypothetical protein